MIKAILFDLDGTLLPMDQDTFVKAYFKGLCGCVAPYGYKPDDMVKNIWSGIAAMVANDGSVSNEQLFWQALEKAYGERILRDKKYFDEYYKNDFHKVKDSCGFNPRIKPFIDSLKAKGVTMALATNPLFPRIATQSRIGWAGLNPDDFRLYTTYENSCHCKPNPDYYRDILKELNLSAEECVMVGNDVAEDMIAESLGMKVFLLTDCLINKNNRDISKYPKGNLDDLEAYLDKILK